jgi:hypothetical protein
LLNKFWGWCDQQLPDGTLIWTSPSGQTYITTQRRHNQRTRNAEERRREESRIIANDEPPPF